MSTLDASRRMSLALTACALVVAVAAGCDPTGGPPPSPVASTNGPSSTPSMSPLPMGLSSATPAELPSANFKDTTMRGSAGDGRSWELETHDIRYDDSKKTATATNIKCTFYNDKSHKQKVILTSDSADVDMQTQAMAFHGKVTAQASTGEKLEIGHLRWDGKHKKFYGDHEVRLTKGQSSMIGDRLVADSTLHTVEINGHVRIILKSLDDIKMGMPMSPASSAPQSASPSPKSL